MGWLDRFLSWIGFDLEEASPGEAAAAADPEPGPSARDRWPRRPDGALARGELAPRPEPRAELPRGQLVSLPGALGQRVIVMTPRSFDDAQAIADHLKNRRPVLVNLEQLEKDVAQRLIHFLSGTIYALNGEMHRVAAGALFFAPGGVEVIVEGQVPLRGQGG